MKSGVLLVLLEHRFLLEELVKRDFKKKYKRTVLGMGWSMLMPLLTLFVLKVVFGQFFGRGIPHFTSYLFCGLLMFNWFSESTNAGMRCLYANSGIFTKVNVPKYLFLLSWNVQALINFLLTLVVFFFFCWADELQFVWPFLLLVYPVLTMLAFNVGIGMVLSALYVFFRDMDYLWGVFLMLLMYGSAIFYPIDMLSPELQRLFVFNPVFLHISYVREVVLGGAVPGLILHLELALAALAALLTGMFVYRRYNTKFLYYV